MIAPSEKHLQDYVLENPYALGFVDGAEGGEYYADYEIFAREANLPSGRADFLATTLETGAYSVCAIETKKDEITSKSLAQVLRYMSDIRQIWKFAICGMPDPDPSTMHFAVTPKVSGLLVGHSIEDDILIAAFGANAQVALYEFDGTDYRFEFPVPPTSLDSCIDYAHGYIGEEVRRIYMEYLGLIFKADTIAAMYITPSLSEVSEFYKDTGVLND